MSYPEDAYTGDERRRDQPSDRIEWHWPPRYPQPDEVSPDIEDLITDLEKGLGGEAPVEDDEELDENMMLELQARFSRLGVEDPKSFDINRFREFGSLIFAGYSLEDVHYDAYSGIRAKDPSRYVSIKVDSILAEMPTDDHMPEITRLQRRQTLKAAKFLISLGIDRDELKEVVSNGRDEEKFELRCLYRLLQERRLMGLVRDLRRRRSDSWEDYTVEYGNVVYDALRIINTAKQEHINLQPTTPDGKLGYKLDDREITRALSFANPLLGISRPE